MELKNEIIRRNKTIKYNYEALGAEIKRHRLALDLTLQSVASDDCSVSYLCKIERNQVKPSSKYLKEICKKVNISEEKISYLLKSHDLLNEAIKYYFFTDVEKEKEYLIRLEGLDNYRSELVRLIFNLNLGNLSAALTAINKIWRLVGSLSDFDLMIFSGFYGIYKFLTKEYVEAFDYLKLALDFSFDINYFKAIILEVLVEVSLTISSPRVYRYYNLLCLEKNKYGENLNLDRINYYMGLYYLKIKDEKMYQETKLKIADKNLIYNLEVMYQITTKQKLNDINEFNLNELTLIPYLLITNKEDLLNKIDKTKLKTEIKMYYKYLYYKSTDLDKAFEFLIDICYPYVILKSHLGLAKFYLKEVAKDIIRPAKYKRFYNMYLDLIGCEEIVEAL